MTEKKAEKAEKKPRKPRMVHEVAQSGAEITLRGEVTLKGLSDADKTAHKVVSVEGPTDRECGLEVTRIKFKSPAAAKSFFDRNFTATKDLFIIDSSKVCWSSESIGALADRIVNETLSEDDDLEDGLVDDPDEEEDEDAS